ncbi:DUF6088 family protein [Odoribacter sp. OttesenSCG-928-L07]|nr:DUF6088 family protein [Odoribacter sp. OttesenSCG-928-L07]MDL2239320.1 DUF6088 family protein [Bacteroidales bacterium OttesenSCG-928-L14]MDL2240365.1 DUF6088 family protein [Bacteroidales bacterium OttesenSCG-928-K22]
MTNDIKNIIEKFELGYVFTITDFPMAEENPKGVSKILNNFVATGYLRKLSKGRFYKPKMSKFGELPPDTYQIVKDLIQKDGKIIGYITGYSAFNDFALTTQVSAILEIGMRKEKKTIIRGVYRIRFIRQDNTITKENIPLLRLLDCLRFFKNIPDTTSDNACQRLIYLIKELNEQEISKIKKLALKYTPQTIALLGVILETINSQEDTSLLFKKLNPITVYKLGISNKILPTQKKWNIQ